MKKIAILGNTASFHEIAAKTYFKQAIEIIPCTNSEEVLNQISTNPDCTGGVLAVENSLAGLVPNHYEALRNSGIKIGGELILKIQHHLMALPNTDIHDLWEIRSHPIAIKQCKNALAHIHPSTRLLNVSDTATAAKNIEEEGLEGVAAIASQAAAKHYGLEIIAPNIADNQHNYTRFLMLQNIEVEEKTQHNKATFKFTLHHKVGSLAKILQLLQDANINLSRLHSSPIESNNQQYAFLVDVEFGHINRFNNAIKRLKQHTQHLEILGTYQKDIKHQILATVNN